MIPTETLKQCWFIAGPTASGKTATAIEIANVLNAEIISMDSMAVYRRMDIGTAKPSQLEQNQAVHHLIDIVDVHEEFSVSDYAALAAEKAQQILERQRVPMFVGGTGLYLRSLLRGVFQGPEANWELRRELEQQANVKGVEWLHAELQKIDSLTAARLHPHDMRRVIRAIEVYHATGQPMSSLHSEQPLPKDQRPRAVFWLEPPRKWIRDRIAFRVDQMMTQGLLEETRQLLATVPSPGRTARQALGYRELIAHLEQGMPLPKAVQQIKTGTCQFAKRQHTWFRNLEECQAVAIDGDDTPGSIAQRLMKLAGEERLDT